MEKTSSGPRDRVAVFAPLYPPAYRGGGPIRSIVALVASAPEGLRPAVLTSDHDLGQAEALPVVANKWQSNQHDDVCYVSVTSVSAFARALGALRIKRPVLIHLNSFMNPRFSIVPALLWRFGFWGDATLLLSPRGEFGKGALGRRSMKKRAYMRVFRALRLHRRVIWHSTAPHETTDIKRIWGGSATILERENSTLLSPFALEPDVSDGPLRAVFLGRLVAHKGLDLALSALASVTSHVHLDVFGSREDEAYTRECERLASLLPPHVSVSFRGALSPDQVVPELRLHDALLMPTAGENFGHVIAEALSASCAVAVTPLTPWTDDLNAGGGLVLNRDVRSWTRGIEQLAAASPAERLEFRVAAGSLYEEWLARPRAAHVWSGALELTKDSRRVHRD